MSGLQGAAVRLSVGVCAVFGLLSGCVTGGRAALSADTPPPAHDGGDATESVNLGLRWEQACTGGEAKACSNLGTLYEQGRGVPQDERRAATLYEQACSDGEMRGCFNLGLLYAQGLGVPQDERRAATLYEQACRAGMSEACARR